MSEKRTNRGANTPYVLAQSIYRPSETLWTFIECIFFVWVDVFNLCMDLMAFKITTDDEYSYRTSDAAIAFIFLSSTIFGRCASSIHRNTENAVIAGGRKMMEASYWTHGELLLLSFLTLSCSSTVVRWIVAHSYGDSTLYVRYSRFSSYRQSVYRSIIECVDIISNNYAGVIVMGKLHYDGPK